MFVSGMSGNEIWCLAQKGYRPGGLAVGNSVVSLGAIGGVTAGVRALGGGELRNVTSLISEGRHRSIERMVQEAAGHGAVGITSVTSGLRSFGGYLEFLAQGTSLLTDAPAPAGVVPFTTASSGMELFCHLDAGYRPLRFAMGNVAYALGVGRSFTSNLRTMARGEVRELSDMYATVRRLALDRLRAEALDAGGNAVVDVKIDLLPFQGALELLMTGTASLHPATPKATRADEVRTSELTGEELWNLAGVGLAPVQLVMATTVWSLGMVGGWGSSLRAFSRGELPELTSLVQDARHRCVELLREEATKAGGEQVIGNRLSFRELSPGLVEVMGIGTAVRRATGIAPSTPTLPAQAVIVERDALSHGFERQPAPVHVPGPPAQAGCLGTIVLGAVGLCAGLLS